MHRTHCLSGSDSLGRASGDAPGRVNLFIRFAGRNGHAPIPRTALLLRTLRRHELAGPAPRPVRVAVGLRRFHPVVVSRPRVQALQ
jgi:hypothetical protein